MFTTQETTQKNEFDLDEHARFRMVADNIISEHQDNWDLVNRLVGAYRYDLQQKDLIIEALKQQLANQL